MIHFNRMEFEMMQQEIDKQELLTFRETSEWIKVKIPTLRKWAAQRQMPVVRIGRGLRVPASWVRDQIRQGYQPVIHRDSSHETKGR